MPPPSKAKGKAQPAKESTRVVEFDNSIVTPVKDGKTPKPSAAAFARFPKKATTVADLVKVHGAVSRGDVREWSKRGWVTVTAPKTK